MIKKIIPDLLVRIDKVLATMPISDEDKLNFRETIEVTLFSNILEKLMNEVRRGDYVGPDVEIIKAATKSNIQELNQALVRFFSTLPNDRKLALTQHVFLSSGHIIGLAMKPLLEIINQVKRKEVFEILQLPKDFF